MKSILLIIFSICLLNFETIAQDAETKLKEKGIVLASPPAPVANYVNAVRAGNLLFLAGKGPTGLDGSNITEMYALPFGIAVEVEVIVEIEQ